MTVRYCEILRLDSIGFSRRNIALSVPCSRNTVAKTLDRAKELGLTWPLPEGTTDKSLEKELFGKEESGVHSDRRMPDYDYIRNERSRNESTNKKLLWREYLEECRQSGQKPLMYSQFCYYIQKDEEKRRATMHINRKPGEEIEVDQRLPLAISTRSLLRSRLGKAIRHTSSIPIPESGSKPEFLSAFCPTASIPMSKRFRMKRLHRGSKHTFICSTTSAV